MRSALAEHLPDRHPWYVDEAGHLVLTEDLARHGASHHGGELVSGRALALLGRAPLFGGSFEGLLSLGLGIRG